MNLFLREMEALVQRIDFRISEIILKVKKNLEKWHTSMRSWVKNFIFYFIYFFFITTIVAVISTLLPRLVLNKFILSEFTCNPKLKQIQFFKIIVKGTFTKYNTENILEGSMKCHNTFVSIHFQLSFQNLINLFRPNTANHIRIVMKNFGSNDLYLNS